MSFVNPIQGYIPNSEFIYTTTNVNADNVTCIDLTATNANITNLVTTTFSPVNINGTNLTCVNATIDNATINNADITTEVVQTSYITLLNAASAVITNAIINNISTGDIDLNNIIIKEQSSSLTDKSIIYRDANQILFVGRQDANTSNGVDYLFYTGLKAGVPTFKIYKTNLCEATNMTILNVLTSKYSNTELLELIDTTLANRKSYIELVNGEFKFIAGTSANTNILFYNKLTDGPMLTINSTGIETPEIEVTTIDSGTIDTDLALFSDSSNNNDKSRIYREGNVLKIAQGAVPGDADASIFFYIGPPTGTPPLKIDKNNNKTTTIDFASDDIFSLRGTINTFNSTSISSPAISGDDIETQNILWNDKITSNDSFFDRENDVFRFNGSSGITPVDWEFYKTSGINPIVKIEAATDTMTVAGSIVGNISQNLAAGVGISLSTTTGGITTISNNAPIPAILNINTLNSTTINNSGTITSNVLNGDISGNLAAGTGISLSTSGNVTTISNTGAVSDPLTINTINSTTINNSGTITSNVLNGDISGNLTAGTNITLSTTGGNTTINSTTPDPLTINTLNSTTINNSGDINNTTGNINLDVNTGKVYANEFNGSIGRIRSIVSAQNGSYFLNNSTGTGSFAIFSSATGDFYLNTHPSNLNFGSTSASTGPVAMTINGTTKDIEIFTDLTTVDITNSGTITSNILNGDISNNLTAGTGISLSTTAGITTISNTGAVSDPLTINTINSTTINNSGTITTASLQGDIFSNLSAGSGVTISQNTPSAGITQISATGLSTSTQYAFKAYSTSGDAYSINGAVTIPYNSLAPQTGFDGYSIPNASSYNTSQATYTIPVSGYWYIGYTLRQRTTSTTNALVAIYRNGSIYMINGNYTGNNEGMSITLYADAGDLFYVRSISGSFSVDMRPTAAMFYGFLLQPENNTVTASTDLSIQSLNVTNNITATSITADLSPNLNAGLNMGLSTTAGVTTISSAQQIFCLSLTNNITPGAAVTGRSIIYDTIKYDSGGGVFVYEPLTGETEVTLGGNYCISAAGNLKNATYTDRVNFRIRFRVNGTWIAGYPQAYSYARHQNYARYATSVITDFCLPLNAGDKIDIFCNVAKATNSNFTSDFGGLQLFNGATFTIKRI